MSYLRKTLPSMNALFVFEAAARRGNFSKAAEELNVTQPAVSRMLARLEDRLCVALFQRTPTGLVLTEDGQLLYQRISDGFRGIETAVREIEARRTGTETVTLSVSTAFTTHWLMPRMNKLQREFPSVDLRFQLLAGPLGGQVDDVDLGMRFVDGDDARHQAVLIMPEILLPICSPAYREEMTKPDDRSDLGAKTIINLNKAQPDWSSLFSFGAGASKAAVAANSLIFSDYAIVVQAALLGQGVALGWVNVVSHWLRTGSLVPAASDVIVTGRLCHLVNSRDRPVRSATADIRDWIIEETRADVAAIDRMYPALQLAAKCSVEKGRKAAGRH